MTTRRQRRRSMGRLDTLEKKLDRVVDRLQELVDRAESLPDDYGVILRRLPETAEGHLAVLTRIVERGALPSGGGAAPMKGCRGTLGFSTGAPSADFAKSAASVSTPARAIESGSRPEGKAQLGNNGCRWVVHAPAACAWVPLDDRSQPFPIFSLGDGRSGACDTRFRTQPTGTVPDRNVTLRSSFPLNSTTWETVGLVTGPLGQNVTMDQTPYVMCGVLVDDVVFHNCDSPMGRRMAEDSLSGAPVRR